MSPVEALSAFAIAAGLLTVTPGLDTALLLRTAAAEGPRRAALCGAGGCLGTIGWGGVVALGLGVLLTASVVAYEMLKWIGAAYLMWLGIQLILRPRSRFDEPGASQRGGSDWMWLRRGALNNLLNPKVGVFYVSFLPQFVPSGVPVAPWIMLLAALHATMGATWFAALILATHPITRWLKKGIVVRWLDRVTGGVFIAFGMRLALDRR